VNVTAIKTHIITEKDIDITAVLDRYVTHVKENSVLAVTSKIVSLTEGRIIPVEKADKDVLIAQEASLYLPRETNPYNVSFTITHDNLVATAGIDESNANDHYVLWPKDPYESANSIRSYLRKKFNLKNLGVIIVDSRTAPLRWGVTAFALAYSGFKPLKDYTGTPDLFGRAFVFEKLNIADSLATTAGFTMGEGNEQTPMAIIEEIPHIQFVDSDPSQEELNVLAIDIDSDLYGPFLKKAAWKKGKGK
jgi:putative folate metabolism gamma-glutamate ligase